MMLPTKGKEDTMNGKRLESSIRAYFAACDQTRERTPLKNGGFEERQIPYTLYGLAVATGYAPKRIVELANSGEGAAAKLFREAVSRIEAYTLERALLGELSHQMALAALEELGGSTPAATAEHIEITMDEAAERWSR